MEKDKKKKKKEVIKVVSPNGGVQFIEGKEPLIKPTLSKKWEETKENLLKAKLVPILENEEENGEMPDVQEESKDISPELDAEDTQDMENEDDSENEEGSDNEGADDEAESDPEVDQEKAEKINELSIFLAGMFGLDQDKIDQVVDFINNIGNEEIDNQEEESQEGEIPEEKEQQSLSEGSDSQIDPEERALKLKILEENAKHRRSLIDKYFDNH